jgi:plastocyanin
MTGILRLGLAAGIAASAAFGPVAYGAMDHGHDGGGSGGSTVTIAYASYLPSHLDVLAGETVTWDNTSARGHTVTAVDGSFDSGRVNTNEHFKRTFGASGAYPYYCRLHPTIRGEVDAHELLLDQQPESAAPGRSYEIGGRAALPAGTQVSIEGDSGSGYAPVASADVGSDGSFSAMVTPARTTRYRAVSGSASSPPVELVVIDHKVRAVGVRHGRAVVVGATVSPPAHGQTAVLQVRSRERFGWWPTRRARLNHHSSVRFVLHTARRVQARVVLTRSDGATVLAQSPSLVVRAARSR